MSRIGKLPITIPAGVDLSVKGSVVSVKGPKGTESIALPKRVKITVDGNTVTIDRVGNDRISRANHGLARTLVNNLVVGVSEGFSKKLIVEGLGYRVELDKDVLSFAIGFSHPIRYHLPDDIEAVVEPKTNTITLSGSNKWKLGQVAAIIRSFKPPEPFKGKGIRYSDEVIRRKVGKTA